jgi:hypothetical protein
VKKPNSTMSSLFVICAGLAVAVATNVCEHKSQSEESQIIYERFFSKPSPHRNGFFVEMGGLDGVLFSNSWFFEECLGWRGLLLEGNPANYNAMVLNRPHTTNLHMAVCRKEQVVQFTVGGGAIAGAMQTMAASFLQKWHHTTQPRTVDVYCGPLAHQFCLLGIVEIDFFSLDIEGAELEAIASIDFTRVSIHVLVVEADEHNPDKNEAVRDILRRNDFELFTDVVPRSDLFVNKIWPRPRRPHMPCLNYKVQ